MVELKNFEQLKFVRTDFRESIRLVQFQMTKELLDFQRFYIFDDQENYIVKEILWQRIKTTELLLQMNSWKIF